MNKINKFTLLFVGILLVGCSSKKEVGVILKEVKVSDLASPPSEFMMTPPRMKEKIPLGASNAEALKVITDNNREYRETERKVILLQEKMRELFSDLYEKQ